MCGSSGSSNTDMLQRRELICLICLATLKQGLMPHIGCQRCYTGKLNDPVPQDYTRDIPDI